MSYSRLLNAVEGNTTFYALPAPATVQRWAEQAHPGFEFVFKVPQTITHQHRLREVDALLGEFLRLLEPVHHLTGAVTLQLPASFAPVDLGVLDAALRVLPAGWRWAVEVRHRGFFEGPGRAALDRLLARRGVERVLLDSRALFARPPLTEAGREAWERKPRIPALTEALTDRPVVRFIGSDHADLTGSGLVEWQPIVAAWLEEGRTPTFFVHTPDNLDAPALARSFHAEVGLLVPGLRELPEPDPVEDFEQESLF